MPTYSNLSTGGRSSGEAVAMAARAPRFGDFGFEVVGERPRPRWMAGDRHTNTHQQMECGAGAVISGVQKSRFCRDEKWNWLGSAQIICSLYYLFFVCVVCFVCLLSCVVWCVCVVLLMSFLVGLFCLFVLNCTSSGGGGLFQIKKCFTRLADWFEHFLKATRFPPVETLEATDLMDDIGFLPT